MNGPPGTLLVDASPLIIVIIASSMGKEVHDPWAFYLHARSSLPYSFLLKMASMRQTLNIIEYIVYHIH
jgi:hypothetical protein